LGFALTGALAVTMMATMLLGNLLVKSAPESAAVARRSKRILRSIPTAFKKERHLRDDGRSGSARAGGEVRPL
jgi:hypothetical protein